MSNFRLTNRDMDFLLPPSIDEWLPQRHLARFVVEVIEALDLRAMTGSDRGSGEAPYHPRRLLGRRVPQLPVEAPLPSDPVNLTDEESRIMPVAGGGFEQCDNAQAVVAEDSLLVVATDVVQAPNDKQQLEPMPGKIVELPAELVRGVSCLPTTGIQREQRERLRRRRD